jgi:predicted metal-dependent phosphoesterase TrpH
MRRSSQNIDEAFIKFLRKGCSAYAERYRLMPVEAMQAILQAGGVPVLAHPFTLNAKTEGDLDRIVAGLKQVGLKGLEAYYPAHGPVRTAQYERLAHRHGLLITGGSDFHGAVKPEIYIGFGRGDLRIPYRLVEELKRSASSSKYSD